MGREWLFSPVSSFCDAYSVFIHLFQCYKYYYYSWESHSNRFIWWRNFPAALFIREFENDAKRWVKQQKMWMKPTLNEEGQLRFMIELFSLLFRLQPIYSCFVFLFSFAVAIEIIWKTRNSFENTHSLSHTQTHKHNQTQLLSYVPMRNACASMMTKTMMDDDHIIQHNDLDTHLLTVRTISF